MQRKNIIRSALFFGIAITVLLIIKNLITTDNLTAEVILKFVFTSIVSGLLAGLVYGLGLNIILRSKFIKEGGKFNKDADEEMLLEGMANHLKGMEAVGGRIYLTNKRLVFSSHKMNIQAHQLSIGLNDISNIERYKTLGIVNNGLIIYTKQNTTEKFVINETSKWVEAINQKLSGTTVLA